MSNTWERAARSGLTIMTSNRRDFLRLHTEHAGIVIADQQMGIGTRIARLQRLAETWTKLLSQWDDDPN
jgi:hypothetical protein